MAGEYHSLKKQHYLKLIKECAHSRKTNREWCSENGIAYSSFMRWQALLRDEAAGKVMEQQAIVPVKIAPPAPGDSHPERWSVNFLAKYSACCIHSGNCERTRLMLGDIRQAQNVYIVTGYTDMRKGLRSLVPYVMQNFKMDPYDRGLFLFVTDQ